MNDYDKSNRSDLLFDAIRPFLRAGDSILDVGCGFAAYPKMQGTTLPRLIHDALDAIYVGIDHRADIIDQCKLAYPWAEWVAGDAGTFVPKNKYSAVFHLGFDRKDLSDAWRVHARLSPRVVLLEAGSPMGKHSGHLDCWLGVKTFYEAHDYALAVQGAYVWTYKVSQPSRRFAILEKR